MQIHCRLKGFIIRCTFFFLSIGWKPTTWPANNCLHIIIVCSCIVTSNHDLLQIIFCSCVIRTTLSREKWPISFPEPTCLLVSTKTRSSGIINVLGVPVSRRMRGLVYMASRDKVDVDAFHKGIQHTLGKLGKSKFAFERLAVSNFKRKHTWALGTTLLIIPELRVLVLTKRHVGSANEIEKWQIAFLSYQEVIP